MDVLSDSAGQVTVREKVVYLGATTNSREKTYASAEASSQMQVFLGEITYPLQETRTENLAVPAGTFACTKQTYLKSSPGATVRLEVWSKDSAVMKMVKTFRFDSLTALASLTPDNVPALPVPANLIGFGVVYSYELKSYAD